MFDPNPVGGGDDVADISSDGGVDKEICSSPRERLSRITSASVPERAV